MWVQSLHTTLIKLKKPPAAVVTSGNMCGLVYLPNKHVFMQHVGLGTDEPLHSEPNCAEGLNHFASRLYIVERNALNDFVNFLTNFPSQKGA